MTRPSTCASAPSCRQPHITLAHLVGLSRAAIGVEMGKTEEAVRALVHRAKARLALLLDTATG